MLLACGTSHNLCPTNANFSTISSSPNPHSRQRHSLCEQQRRSYAQFASGKGPFPTNSDNHPWPEAPSATSSPCPYDIFGLKRGAPYSKRRFYELVKIYHPDRDGHDTSSVGRLSSVIRLHRYRLIIKANEILSDPDKKKAYDKYRVGWDGIADIAARRGDSGSSWSSFYDKDSPARNATWEDWEQWYQRGQRAEQKPLYISNGSFVVLILSFAILGGMYEMSRAGRLSKTLLQQLEAIHDKSSKDLIRRRQDSQGFESNDQRMQNFLRSRDPETYTNRPARD